MIKYIMNNTSLEHKHELININMQTMTAECSICGPVTIYVSRPRDRLNGGTTVAEKPANRLNENAKIIREHMRKHPCKRCGVNSRGIKNKFYFFELHLPPEQRVQQLMHSMEPDRLKAEIENRDLYCKKCFPLVVRDYRKAEGDHPQQAFCPKIP